MAKKNKGKKSYSRRRRVSGMGNLDLQAMGLGLLGAVAANKLTAELKKKTGTMAEVAPFAALGIGLVVQLMVKNTMAKQVGAGLVIGGGLETLKKVAPKLVAGPYSLPVVSGPGRRRINGGVMNPGAVGAGYSPARSSAYANRDALSVISGVGKAGSVGAAMAAAGM